MFNFFYFLVTFLLQFYLVTSDEFFCNINSKRVLHKVSDKFLSVSIDPAVLFAGVNLSDTSLLLAQKISPSFIRLAGPSTRYVKYIDDEDFYQQMTEKSNNVYVTPSMWFGINEWFKVANLTPIFSVNDIERSNGNWDPKNVHPLIELSDKFDVDCYWQLGYDCSNKTLTQYVDDLSILKQILSVYPDHRNVWRIVGSDLSKCMSNHPRMGGEIKKKMDSLGGIVDAIVLEQSSNPYEDNFYPLDDTTISLWTTVPKSTKPVTFSSAILWAKQVGEAARSGHDVIFRQPRLKEISFVTPVYWFSFLHKKLMGTTVLDIKPSSAKNSDTLIFAHCTKYQNEMAKSGAVTVLAINDDVEKSIAKVRINSIFLEKTMEVQCYVLTSNNDDSTETLLNDKNLEMSHLYNFTLTPKVRRTKVLNHVSLEIPSKSIAFFVLTGARVPVCVNNEQQKYNILEDKEIVTKPKLENRKTSLEAIKNQMLEELKVDNQFYEKHKDLHNQIEKYVEKNKKDVINAKKLNNPLKKNVENHFTLSIKEIENILKQRAKERAAEKNIQLNSAELDVIIQEATINLPKNIFSKRNVSPNRAKRDINRVLLDQRAAFYKTNMFDQETYEKIHNSKPHTKKNTSKPKRSINQQLLKIKAALEEGRKKIMKSSQARQISDMYKKFLNKFRIKRDINFDMLKKRTQYFSERNNKRSRFINNPIEELFNPSILSRNKLSENNMFDADKDSSEKKPSKFALGISKKPAPASKISKNKHFKEKVSDLDSYDIFDGEFSYMDDIMLSPELERPNRKKVKNELDLLEVWRQELKNKDKNIEDDYDLISHDFMRKKRYIEPLQKNLTSITEDLGLKRKTIKKELNDIKKNKEKLKNEKSQYIIKKRQYLKNKIRKQFDHNIPKNIMKIDNKKNKFRKQTKLSNIRKTTKNNQISKVNILLDRMNVEEKTVPTDERIKRSLLVDNAVDNIKSTLGAYSIVDDVNNAIQSKLSETIFENVNPLNRLNAFSLNKNPLLTHNLIDKNIFGQYKPLSLGLRPWRPSDILNLNRFNPINPLNMLIRTKRHIDDYNLDYLENTIIDSNENKISAEDDGKYNLKNFNYSEKYKNLSKKKVSKEILIKSDENGKENVKNTFEKLSEKPKLNEGFNLAKNIIDLTTSEVKKRMNHFDEKMKPTMPIFGEGNNNIVKNIAQKAQNLFGSGFNDVLKYNPSETETNRVVEPNKKLEIEGIIKSRPLFFKNIAAKTKNAIENGVNNFLELNSSPKGETSTEDVTEKYQKFTELSSKLKDDPSSFKDFGNKLLRDQHLAHDTKNALKSKDLFGKIVAEKNSNEKNKKPILVETKNKDLKIEISPIDEKYSEDDETSLLGQNNPIKKIASKTKNFVANIKNRISSLFEDIF